MLIYYIFIFTFILFYTYFFLWSSLGRNWIFKQLLVFTGYSSIQFFNSSLPLIQSVRLRRVPYHLLCSTHGTYEMPFPVNPYLVKQRISLRVASILSMEACARIFSFLHPKGISCFYLCVGLCYEKLYVCRWFWTQSLVGFYVVRFLSYPPGHTTF